MFAIISINTIAHSFQGCEQVIAYSLQWIKFRLHWTFCIDIYKLTYWLVQCNFKINYWLNDLCSCKCFNFPSIMEQHKCLQHPKPGKPLISTIVVPHFIHHKPVIREVYQHWTKLFSISIWNSQAKKQSSISTFCHYNALFKIFPELIVTSL